MENIIEIGAIGNYYGGLAIGEQGGKYFWAIENWDGYNWVEIPESLYLALKQYQDGQNHG
jgi:hypothetical protein